MTPSSLDLFNLVYENPIHQTALSESSHEYDPSRAVVQEPSRYLDASLFDQQHMITGAEEGTFVPVVIQWLFHFQEVYCHLLIRLYIMTCFLPES